MIILIIGISRIYHFSLKYIVSLRLQSNVRLHNFDNRRMIYASEFLKRKILVGSCVLHIHRIDRGLKFAGALTLQKEKDAHTFVFAWISPFPDFLSLECATKYHQRLTSTLVFLVFFFSFLLKNEKNETNTTAFLLFSSISTLICKDKKLTDFGIITNRREPKARREFRDSKFKQVRIFGTIMSFCHATRSSKHFLRKLGTFGRIRTNNEI